MTQTRMVTPVLPSAGPAREALREKGQFWTPDWVAEAMVAYVVSGGAAHVFDPAVGAGAFFRAAKAVSHEIGRSLTLLGSEIDPEALDEARRTGLSADDLAGVTLNDFARCPPTGPFSAIVANPPYIRHHRIPAAVKDELQAYGLGLIGMTLDGRAGLHVYFLLRALQLLAPEGRLAFLMPADTCEGIFAETLWTWITRCYRLEAAVTFSPGAAPFPKVDTNAVIFLISNRPPQDQFLWATCRTAATPALKHWTLGRLKDVSGGDLTVVRRTISEGLSTGLSRPPRQEKQSELTLGDFARVRRGIATGANEFFFLTRGQVKDLALPESFFVPAIGRTRDVTGDCFSAADLDAVEKSGRPTRLLALDGRDLDDLPPVIQEYLGGESHWGCRSGP